MDGAPEPLADPSYAAAYDAVLARWPQPVEQFDVDTPFGATHVLATGPADGTPLVLLPGGGATATVWWANVGDLSGAGHRVLAVDPLTDAGRSVPAGRGVRTPDDVAAWFAALLNGLGLARTRLAGHSHGAWTALGSTLAHPDRVERLVLLDPTSVVSGLSPGYLAHALPVLLRPTGGRVRSLLSWETRGQTLDQDWVRLFAAGLAQRRRPVRPRRPPGSCASSPSPRWWSSPISAGRTTPRRSPGGCANSYRWPTSGGCRGPPTTRCRPCPRPSWTRCCCPSWVEEDVRVAPTLRTARFAELTPAELYGILRLRVDVFVVEQTCPYPELDGRDAEPGTVHLWYAAADGTVLATVRVLENGADRAIGRVATAVTARGHGLSAELVRRGIGLCAGRTIDIGAQAYLAAWYERFGFRRSGPDYLEDDILHLPMRLAGAPVG